METKLYLKEADVAYLTSISVKSLRNDRWRRVGIPFVKRGRSVLYLRSDVESYLEGLKVKTSPHNGNL
jgi:hypothetical protein